MPRLLLEPHPHAAVLRSRRAPARPRGLAVASTPSRVAVQGALVGAGLGAAGAGLVGVRGGLVLLVLGVWTVRGVWGEPPGLAWGLAVLTAALRWRSAGMADVQAATRTLAPAVAAAPALAGAGAGAALLAALVEESARDALRSPSAALRLAGGAALLALVPAFLAPGPSAREILTIAWWVAAAAATAVVTLAGTRPAARIPSWTPPAVAAVGALLVSAART